MNTSVIICTHNPREGYLQRVLAALREQTLPNDQWELLLIDNASKEPLAATWDLSWHPNARHVREDELGLTPARLRGIKEASGELLIFVDDDNLLDADYLTQALNIYAQFPFLGVFGGKIKGEYEVPPEPWMIGYLGHLVICELNRDSWSNLIGTWHTTPPGAGLCVRRSIACAYAQRLATDPSRQSLDRKGQSLVSGGDNDIAFVACDEGLGMGKFTRLMLTHLIPKERLTMEYLVRLSKGLAYSYRLLMFAWGLDPQVGRPTWQGRLLRWIQLMRQPYQVRFITKARAQGDREAERVISEFQKARRTQDYSAEALGTK